jgi:MFS family permease
VLRTIGVFITGTLLAMVLVAANTYLAAYVIPARFDSYLYFGFMALVGLVVGLVIGALQKNKAGAVAVTCLLPLLFFEIWAPYSSHWRTWQLVVFSLGQALELSLAFSIAYQVSKRRRHAV